MRASRSEGQRHLAAGAANLEHAAGGLRRQIAEPAEAMQRQLRQQRCVMASGTGLLERGRCRRAEGIVLGGIVSGGVDEVALAPGGHHPTVAASDSYRAAALPQNLTQAQRDAFGAHTYRRADDPDGHPVHTEWLR